MASSKNADQSESGPELAIGLDGGNVLIHRCIHTGDILCVEKMPPISELESSNSIDFYIWSILIDIKLFGRETPFSRISKKHADV